LPKIFQKVNHKYRTPVISIVAFSSVAALELVFAALQGNDGFRFLGDLYAFGAAASYTLVFCALIALRLNDPLTPRKFLIPLNIPIKFRGERAYFPLIGIVGLLGILAILVFVLLTHPIGRIAGPSWLIVGTLGYLLYRHKKGLPLFRSRPRDWSADQLVILRESGELELMDELAEKIRVRKVTAGE
jgi:amino acid transporter